MRLGRAAAVGLVILLTAAACAHTPVVGDLFPESSPSPSHFTASGQGDKVISPYHLPAGDYRVTWTAQDTGVFHVSLGGLDSTINDRNLGVLVNWSCAFECLVKLAKS